MQLGKKYNKIVSVTRVEASPPRVLVLYEDMTGACLSKDFKHQLPIDFDEMGIDMVEITAAAFHFAPFSDEVRVISR